MKLHLKMLLHAIKLVLGGLILGVLALVIVALMMLASVSYAQHRVDVNMARQEMAEQVLERE